MSTTTVEISELLARLKEVLALAEGGAEVVLTENGVARARLVAPSPARTEPRVPGLHPGIFQPSEDFDAPLPDDFWLGKE